MNQSMHHLSSANHWAVLVAGILFWFLGAAWYSPALFAKPWMAALGIVPGGVKKGMIKAMIASLAGNLVSAFVMLHFIEWSGAHTTGTGAFIGFLCWLGFFAAIQLPQGLYEQRPTILFVINGGYWLIGLVGTGILLAVWR